MSYLVAHRDAEERECGWVVVGQSEVCEEAEEILGVYFATIEGTGNIHATLNVVRKERRIDGLCLQ